jgi:2-methylcitrate dehydratase PrpD
MTVVERCAAFAVEFAQAPIPPHVTHHAKRALIDWTAALYPGAIVAPSTLMEQAFVDDLDRGNSTLALGRKATARVAALINGTAAHTVEVDDIFRDAIYHPGAPTIAAALAVAEDTGASGEAFLKAIIIGYEISCRIGQAMGKAHYAYWHNTGTIGTFGATAAAASLYGLDAARFAHALATCTTFAAGLQQAFRMDSMSKPLHAGRAAEAGIVAAQMARAGVTGALDVIEGDVGFGRALSADREHGPDWQRAVATLGQQFHVTEMTFKNHACCGHTFAAIDGALIAQKQLGVTADQIQSVRVETYRAALDVAGNPSPVTAAEARFSLPYVVATALVHGSVRLSAVTPERLACPITRALMRRLDLAVDPAMNAAFPGARAARVDIITRDGRRATHVQPTRKGDPDQPLTDAELEAKYVELVTPVLGAAKAARLLQTLWAIDRAGDVRLA